MQMPADRVDENVRSFPRFGRGFDSHRPLHKSRFGCLYAAESLKITLEMVGFGRSMDAAGINWTLLVIDHPDQLLFLNFDRENR
jgi:hypothetical protein